MTLEKLEHLDGVLFPGGDGDYYKLGKFVFDQIIKYNDQGHFYPAWATCLGYEELVGYSATAGNKTWGIFDYHHVSLPLGFVKNPMHTKMYEGLGPRAHEFETHNFTYNSHHFAFSPEVFETDEGLKNFWDVTATSQMPNGTHFVASIEAKNYPIFATQFHPEKPSELWVDGDNINHSWESIRMQEHFSELFVSMTRANANSYGNFTETMPHLVSNYNLLETED